MIFLKSVITTLALAATASAFAQANSMQGMAMDQHADQGAKEVVHQATGVVKSIDAGKVTLAHGPVKTLNWPAMTMTFDVKNKDLLGKLSVGKQVQVTFEKQGSNYVIISAK